MAVANTVEATLASKYIDGISKGIDRTEQIVRQQMSSMIRASASAGDAMGAAFESVVSKVRSWGDHLRSASETADSSFKKTTLGASAMALGIIASLAMVAQSFISFVLDKARAASELTELKLAFEGLAQASGWQVNTFGQLKKATEGLISSSELLRNANRVMQSGVRVSDQMYVELTSNIFRMAKAAGRDGTQAITAMTDALIKGNARSLHAVGLHLDVKDAISEMAAATGASASSVNSAGKMQAFYAEMLEQTRAAVAKLPPDFISLEDAIVRAEKTWDAFFLKIGEGVNRSGVLQEMLKRAMSFLDRLSASKSEVEAIALSTNRVLIDSLRIAAAVMEGIGWIASGVGLLFGALKVVINFLALEIVWTAGRIGNIFLTLINLLAKLPGSAGRFFSGLADSFRTSVDYFDEATRQFANGITSAFDGVGEVQSNLDGMAAGSRSLAADLEKFAGSVVQGTSAVQAQGNAAQVAAEQQKQLADAMKEFIAMRADLVKASLEGEIRVWDAYFRDLKKINDNIAASDSQKHEARLLLAKKYAREMVRIQEEEYNKAAARVRDFKELTEGLLADVIRLGMEVSKLPAAPNYGPATPTNVADDPGYRAIREAEIRRAEELRRIQDAVRASVDRNAPKYYRDLRDALEGLNGLSMNPFVATMKLLRDHVVQVGQDVTSAWSSFWADLVSGQENAGKKFLAAIVQIFAKELLVLAVRHTYLAISAAASMNFAAAARHAAAAAALGAGAGILTGMASAIAGTNQAGASATYQQSISRPTSQTVQMIQVGAAGRSQTPGVTAQQPTPVKHEVVLRLAPGLVAQEAAKDIRNNGPLRVAILGATA